MVAPIDNYFRERREQLPEQLFQGGRPHWIAYHFVWCPKRVKPVLVGEVAQECDSLIRALCKERGWEVLQLSLFPACAHLFVRVSPADSAHGVQREIKAYTANRLRGRYPVLSRLPSLWTRSYLCTTTSQLSDDVLLQYLYAQQRS